MSGSCGCLSSGSTRKITASMSPSTTRLGDLHVAAVWSGSDILDLEPDLVPQQIAGRSGCDQVVFGEPRPIEGRERDEISLLAVVGNDGQPRAISGGIQDWLRQLIVFVWGIHQA